jgi:hypothetical protein
MGYGAAANDDTAAPAAAANSDAEMKKAEKIA